MLRQLIRDSYNHYTNKKMRRQWIRKTLELITTGNHLALTGRFPRKVTL